MALIGLIFARMILTAMSTPKDILDLAVRYLRIYFFGMPFIMLYNFSSSIFRSKGDTKRSLIALAISGVINIVLNLFFVVGLGMNVEGVAIATVVSNAISYSILLYWLVKEEGAFHLEIRQLKIDYNIVKNMAKIGVPAVSTFIVCAVFIIFSRPLVGIFICTCQCMRGRNLWYPYFVDIYCA